MIYVDDLFTATPRTAQARSNGKRWCHMATDGPLEELHAMAERIGLKRAWFQNDYGTHPHYDLVPSKRTLALTYTNEVQTVSTKELIQRCYPILARVMNGQSKE